MKVSIVIPCYNEVETIKLILSRVLSVKIPGVNKEIIVVDDCSSDGTRRELDFFKNSVRLFYHNVNRGKGAALHTGFAAVTGDIVVVQDADLEYDPNDIPALIAPIIQKKADVVYGSRFSAARSHRVPYFWHYLANRIITSISDMLTNLNLTDVETCYKAFRVEVIREITLVERGFAFDPEITAKIARRGYIVFEVAISYDERGYKEGKKITWRDGVAAIYSMFKYRLFG